MIFRLFLAAIAIAIIFSSSAHAQSAEQLKRASELFRQANESYSNSRYDDAIAKYSEYIKIRPTVATGWYNRGLAYRQKAEAAMSRPDFEKALADFSQAIKLDPKDADFWLYRGHVRLRLIPVDFAKQVPGAIADYTEAIKRKPTSAAGYTGRAQAYQETNRLAEAMADLNKALQLDPNDYVALYMRGKIHSFDKRYAASRADLEKAIRLNPQYEVAKIYLNYVNSNDPSRKATAAAATPTATPTKPVATTSTTTTATTDYYRDGFKLADDAEKAGDHRKVIDIVTKTLPTIPMKTKGVPAKDLDAFLYLDLLRKRAKAYLALKLYKEAEDAYIRSATDAAGNMNAFNDKANEAARSDKGSGGGAIMATVQTSSSKIICKSTFVAIGEWGDIIERDRPNDMAMRLTTSIIMATIREMCAHSYYMDGLFEEMRISSYFGAQIKTKQLNTAIERYSEAINYLKVFRPAYVARAKSYRELGRIDLAIADEKKASELPVK